MPSYTPVDYDPFDTKVMGKFEDRVLPGNPASPVLPPPAPIEAPITANIPSMLPQASPAAQIQNRYPPSDSLFVPSIVQPDPAAAAATRQRQSVLPTGGRKEGLATAIPEVAMQELVAVLRKHGLTGLLGGTSLADLAQLPVAQERAR